MTRLPLLALLLLAPCGSGVTATTTRQAELAQIATLAAPTATPAFSRFTAADVVETFKRFGLEATAPKQATGDNQVLFRDVPVRASETWHLTDDNSYRIPNIYALVFSDAGNMEAAWVYMKNNNVNSPFYKRDQIRNGNVILAFLIPLKNPPDDSAYRAAFIGMR